MAGRTLRIAAAGDLHYHNGADGKYRSFFTEVGNTADVLLLCGDIIDYGLTDEARSLIKDISDTAKRIPILAVLGNHEFESGRVDEVSAILKDGGITVLDGDACEIKGVGFAGVKGFAGGFGSRLLEPWGEPIIKQFVHEAMEEALKLGSALARLRTSSRIALLHYAPISATAMGEPLEIFPFLGSSRLEEPLNRYGVTAVFHGHAHRGTLEGKTSGGVPVYNVAMKLLEKSYPGRVPCRLVEVPSDNGKAADQRPAAAS
jgi:Icc-related predicted phosphoesterase